MSPNEDICAKLNVVISSRHSGPAFIAASTSSMAEKAVPISAATVSIPRFGIRVSNMRLETERQTRPPSISDSELSRRNLFIGFWY